LFKELSDSDMERFLDIPSTYNNYFRNSRNTIIASRLKVLASQQINTNGILSDDYVNRKIEASSYKVCVDCSAPNDVDYRICRSS